MSRQYQIPGGKYINETGTRQYQILGSKYVNETVTTSAYTHSRVANHGASPGGAANSRGCVVNSGGV